MIKPTISYGVGVSAINDAIYRIGREYGSPVADSGDAKAEVYTLIVGEGDGPQAQRSIQHADLSMYRIRLIVLPPEVWMVGGRWVLARKGIEGLWSDAP